MRKEYYWVNDYQLRIGDRIYDDNVVIDTATDIEVLRDVAYALSRKVSNPDYHPYEHFEGQPSLEEFTEKELAIATKRVSGLKEELENKVEDIARRNKSISNETKAKMIKAHLDHYRECKEFVDELPAFLKESREYIDERDMYSWTMSVFDAVNWDFELVYDPRIKSIKQAFEVLKLLKKGDKKAAVELLPKDRTDGFRSEVGVLVTKYGGLDGIEAYRQSGEYEDFRNDPEAFEALEKNLKHKENSYNRRSR